MIEKYIPQRPPIQIIDRIISQKENEIVCEVDWPKKKFFLRKDGSCIFPAMVEMVAQASAAMQGVKGVECDKGKIGMLTAVKNFEFHKPPQPNAKIKVVVEIESELGLHQVVAGKISQNDNILAQGSIFLYLSDHS